MTSKAAKKPSPPAAFDLKGQVGSLAARLTEAQPGEKIIKLPLEKVSPNPKQHRKHFDKAALVELGNSIKNGRQELPVIVRPNPEGPTPYILISGERRWRACGLAGVPTVDAIVRQISPDDEAQILVSEATENLQRVNLTVSEEASLIASLVELVGLGQAVSRSGKSKARLSKLVAIHKAAPVVSEVMGLGFVGDVETLYQFGLLAKENESAAVQLAERWKTDEESRAHLRQQIDEVRKPQPAPPTKTTQQNREDGQKPPAEGGGKSSATHMRQGAEEAPTRPVVRPVEAVASPGRSAAGQRAEPSTQKASGSSEVSGSRGDATPPTAPMALKVTGASYEGDVVVLRSGDQVFRFDRTSLHEVLGLDG